MTDPKVIVGHYVAGYSWGIDGKQVIWNAVVTRAGALVGTRGGHVHDSKGAEHVTEEAVREAVRQSILKFIEERGDEDDAVTAYKDD